MSELETDAIYEALRLDSHDASDRMRALSQLSALIEDNYRLRADFLEAQDTIHGCELVIDNQKAIIDRNAWGNSRTSDGGLDGADTAT